LQEETLSVQPAGRGEKGTEERGRGKKSKDALARLDDDLLILPELAKAVVAHLKAAVEAPRDSNRVDGRDLTTADGRARRSTSKTFRRRLAKLEVIASGAVELVREGLLGLAELVGMEVCAKGIGQFS
jgi:hypothetical protein